MLRYLGVSTRRLGYWSAINAISRFDARAFVHYFCCRHRLWVMTMSTMLRRRLFALLVLMCFSVAACGEDSTPQDTNANNTLPDAGLDAGHDGESDAADGETLPDGDGPDADSPEDRKS